MRLLEGRINRATYWPVLVGAVCLILLLQILGLRSSIVEILILSFVAIPRLHDMGWSARWALLPLVGLVAGGLWAGVTFSEPYQREVLVYTLSAMIYVLLIWLGCLKGQPEWNEFGDAPSNGISFPD